MNKFISNKLNKIGTPGLNIGIRWEREREKEKH